MWGMGAQRGQHLVGVSDESASRPVVQFHKNLQAGHEKGEALRQAQIALRREFDSPFYWGNWQ